MLTVADQIESKLTLGVGRLVKDFETLSEEDKHAAIVQLLRRMTTIPCGVIADEGLKSFADELFLMLDASEANHSLN